MMGTTNKKNNGDGTTIISKNTDNETGCSNNNTTNGNIDNGSNESNISNSLSDHHYTISIIAFLVLFFLIFVAYVYFLPHHGPTATECNNTDLANAMMIELNAINNIITWCSFIVATITIIGAIAGIAIFTEFRKRIETDIDQAKKEREEFEQAINARILEIDKKIDDCCEEAKKKIQSLEITQVKQEHYFRKSIDYLYTISSSLLEKTGDTDLRDLTYHDYNITTLYSYVIDEDDIESAWILQDKKEALQNLKETGVLEDITDLEYISENDSSDEIRRLATEVIGIIKHRFGKA